MKRTALLLAVLMIVSVFASCGGTETKDPTTSTNTTEAATTQESTKYANDNLGSYDFKGYQFRNIAREGNNLDVVEETGELLNDAKYYRNRSVEERFNFKFVEKIVPASDYATSQRNSLLAADKAYDIMVIRCPDAYTLAQEGMLHPITELPLVDFSKPYWDEWLTAQWSIANKSYFAAGAYDMSVYGATALLFNKVLAKNLGIGDLYKLVKDGKWTFDEFAKIGTETRKDLNGDGVFTSDDQYGYVGTVKFILPAFWIAGGARTIDKDKDDIPYLSAVDEKFINVWFKLVDATLKSGAWFDKAPNPNLQNDPLLPEMFKAGRALFYDGGIGSAQTFRDMEIDFGIIPYPKLDETQDEYYSRVAWAEMVSIPIYSDETDLERTSIILEALACESAKTVLPVYYDLILKTKYTRDVESEEMIDLILKNRIFDWGDTIWCPLLRDGIFPAIYQFQSDTVVSKLEAAKSSIQVTIDKTVDAFLKLD